MGWSCMGAKGGGGGVVAGGGGGGGVVAGGGGIVMDAVHVGDGVGLREVGASSEPKGGHARLIDT